MSDTIIFILIVVIVILALALLKGFLALVEKDERLRFYEDELKKIKKPKPLVSTGRGKEMIDENNTVRTCYNCGELVDENHILVLDPALGMLLYCKSCHEKDKKEHPEKYDD
jgi:hypothetical protein